MRPSISRRPRARGDRAGRVELLAFAFALASAVLGGCSSSDDGEVVLVGAARRDITPNAVNAPPDGSVYLGGYGFGPERPSTGVLAPIYVRAFVVTGDGGTVAFAENETQGSFAAYQSGPYGHVDVAAAVEAATGGAIPRTHVLIGSDHSHAGPDTTGVWGGVPDSYLEYVRDQTVGAILDAYASREPATLWSGTAEATDLITSQFHEPPNDRIDGELRVLAAVPIGGDPARPRSLLVNYAAHATVMGSDNTLVSADWPGVVSASLEGSLGLDAAVVMVADIGRTQPRDGDVPADTDVERLEGYAARVEERVRAAIGATQPHRGNEVAATQLFLRESYANPLLPISVIGSAISRSNRPPWLDGETIGTVVSAARIGDLFFAAVPGEGYPAIQFAMEELVPADEHFVFGLGNDQLGYLIAPEEGYPQVAAAAPDNDNAIFNVSPGIGDHVECLLLKAARQIGFDLADDPARCAPYAAEDDSLPF